METIEGRVNELLERMNREEKIAQLGGIFPFYFIGDDGNVDYDKMRREVPDGLGHISGAATVGGEDPDKLARTTNAFQRFLVNETRLGIPAIVHNEALCGMMYGPAATFPTAINLAATWQPELIREMADITRRQMRAVGVHHALSPVLDVARDARWGRVHETYGEDPVLCAAFGTAFVRGLQGDDLEQGVIATGKHFLGYGLSQGALNQCTVHLGPRELYEVFALPFEAAIRDADLACVMNSYSEIDGVPVAVSAEVLTGLLRNELGFSGFVVADYGSVTNNLKKHRVARDEFDAAMQALRAGLDVELPQLRCFPTIAGALQKGSDDDAVVDRAVARVLTAKFELGLFDNPYCDEQAVHRCYSIATQEKETARRITESSLVLLENDGILPIDNSMRIAVVGPFADSLRLLFAGYTAAAADELNHYMAAGLSGTMAGVDIDTIDIDTIGEVIFGTRERALPDATVEENTHKLYPEMPTLRQALGRHCSQVEYARGCEVLDSEPTNIEEARAIATRSDVVVCVVGEKSGWVGQATGGEGRDRSTLTLPGRQQELVDQVCASGRPVIVVLISGRPLVLSSASSAPAAVLWAGAPGRFGAEAIADLLFGAVNPSGKLPITFPRGSGQVPHYAATKVGSATNSYIDENTQGALYPFGHGESFSTFELSDLSIAPDLAFADETVHVSCTLTNTGLRGGAETVQLYVHDKQASVTRPVKQLAGFLRVEVEPGASKRLHFHLAVAQLALLDRSYRLVVEPGEIDLLVGTSSERIALRGHFTIDGELSHLECRGPFFAEAEIGGD